MIDLIKKEMDDWKKETDIWATLNKAASDVYCQRFTDFTPALKGKAVYVMVTEEEAVLILKDDYVPKGEDRELADEECFDDEKPLYFAMDSHRISPVYEINAAACAFKFGCELIDKPLTRTICILLTMSEIINYEVMEQMWEELDTIVLHDLKDLDHDIDEHTDAGLPGAHLISAFLSFKDDGVFKFTVDSEYVQKVKQAMSAFDELKKKESEEENEVDEEDEEDEYAATTLLDEDDPDWITESYSTESTNGNVKVKRKLPAVQILKPLNNAKEVLNNLVGLSNIKSHLEDVTCLARYNSRLRECFPNAKTHEINLHGIFYGNVGVGKTTVGRIYGSLLHDCGVLSRGHVVLANRGSFVGTHWGDEEINVRLAVKMAQGGVLMIDEAYTLVSENKNDPGQLVLPQLLEILADESNRDIAVLLCGYEKPLLHLLSTNPGLNSRFVNRYKFSDFTLNELLEISRRRVRQFDYEFTADAWKRYKAVLNDCFLKRNVSTWANARLVANFLEQIYLLHAQRCMKSDVQGKDLLKIRLVDIPQSVATQEKDLRIGFK